MNKYIEKMVISTPLDSFIEVYDEELNKVSSLKEAEMICKKLGNGWRLPTFKELEQIYEKSQKNKYHLFEDSVYISSTLYADGESGEIVEAIDFGTGRREFVKVIKVRFRPVRVR